MGIVVYEVRVREDEARYAEESFLKWGCGFKKIVKKETLFDTSTEAEDAKKSRELLQKSKQVVRNYFFDGVISSIETSNEEKDKLFFKHIKNYRENDCLPSILKSSEKSNYTAPIFRLLCILCRAKPVSAYQDVWKYLRDNLKSTEDDETIKFLGDVIGSERPEKIKNYVVPSQGTINLIGLKGLYVNTKAGNFEEVERIKPAIALFLLSMFPEQIVRALYRVEYAHSEWAKEEIKALDAKNRKAAKEKKALDASKVS